MLLNQHFTIQQYERPGFLISSDPRLFDLDVIHGFLANDSYWAKGIDKEKIERYVQFSLCFGVYQLNEPKINAEPTPDGRDFKYHQVGFARVVTDFTRAAYLADVFILPSYRGQGLGKWLVQSILAHPELQSVGWTLYTDDAHELYKQFGFVVEPRPDKHMVLRPNRPIYQ